MILYLKEGSLIRKMQTAVGGPIKRLKDGYRYIPDEQNRGWNRISNNGMSDVFATYVVEGKDKRADVRIDKKSGNFDRKFKYDETEIPFIKDKEITLTNAGLYTGAKLSTNLLDSIAKYAKISGLPLKTAVGLVAKETSLGNPTVDSSLKKLAGDVFAYKLAKALNGGLHINEGKALNPKDLINFHYEELNPYLGLKNTAYKKSVGNTDDYGRGGPFADENFLKRYRELLKLGENYSDNLAKKLLSNFNPNKNVLQAGFEFYKLNPRRYNYNQTNYPQLVEQRGNMVYNSPEFKSWLSTSEYKKQGGKMNAIELFKQGSKIHIKKKNRGKFTAYCGGNVTSACIAKAKASGNPTLVKRATFANNARHFKHLLGGLIKSREETDRINQSNKNTAKGLFKGIITGNILPTPSNVGRMIGAAWNGWLDPETTAITGEVPNPGMRDPKLIVSSVQTINKFKNILKNYNPYAYRKPELPEIKISDKIIDDANNLKIDFNDLLTDNFIKYLGKQTGRKIKRIPYKNTKDGNIYKEGFSFVDENGKEIAHIAGNLKGKNVWVESSYVDPEFRHKGLGKLMYFDFNDNVYNTYGTTLHSSALQRVGYVDGGGMSPSNRLWKSLTDNKLATIEGGGFNWWNIMADPSKIKTAYRKQGGRICLVKRN